MIVRSRRRPASSTGIAHGRSQPRHTEKLSGSTSITHSVANATRGTLASAKFAQLHEALAPQATFVLQPCDGLAAAIEAGDAPRVEALAAQYVAALGPLGTQDGQADTVVLGCTHYPLVMNVFERLVPPGVGLLETGEPVARQARRLLAQAGLLQEGHAPGTLALLGPGAQAALDAAASRWLSSSCCSNGVPRANAAAACSCASSIYAVDAPAVAPAAKAARHYALNSSSSTPPPCSSQ